MEWLDNIKIGKKLIGSFIGIVIIMIIIGIVGFFGTTSIDSRLTHMYDDQLLPTDVLETMDGDVWELRGDVYKYLSIEKDRSKTKQSIDAITSRLDESIKGYEKEVVSDEEKGVYKNLVDAWGKYHAAVDAGIKDVDSGNPEKMEESLDTGALTTSRKALTDSLKSIHGRQL